MSATEEVVLKETTGIEAYSEFRAQLATLRAENSALVFDYADEKGNKEARSHIHKLRRTKGAVEAARKTEKQASLDYGRRVDSEAKEIIEQIDEMIEVHERPIKEIEEREAARKQAILEKMAALSVFLEAPDTLSAVELSAKLETLVAYVVDESFDESMAAATKLRNEGLEHLRVALETATSREAEAAELARLRAEEAARQQAERERRIAEEAAAKAKAEAEAAAKREQEAAEARERAERERADRAVADAKAAEERAARAAQEAVERERREAAAKAKAEQEAAAKREKDRAHRASINGAAAAALVEGASFLTREQAEAIVVLIAKKMVPAVSIAY